MGIPVLSEHTELNEAEFQLCGIDRLGKLYADIVRVGPESFITCLTCSWGSPKELPTLLRHNPETGEYRASNPSAHRNI